MDQNRGSVLTGNVLAFGIATFCVVALRLGYRAYSRKIGASDWFLVIALVNSRQGYRIEARELTMKFSRFRHFARTPLMQHVCDTAAAQSNRLIVHALMIIFRCYAVGLWTP